MEASRRLTNWLRLACALVLSVGLSSAVATTASDSLTSPSTTPTLTRLNVAAAAVQSVTVRSATTVRHASGKHQPPATASALAGAGILLTGLAAFAVRRRRRDPSLPHHALSHGARAPPAVSCC